MKDIVFTVFVIGSAATAFACWQGHVCAGVFVFVIGMIWNYS